MGSRDFKTHLLYNHYLVITYRSKIVPLDSLDLNISFSRSYIASLGMFRGQSDGRPTSCSAKRSYLVFHIFPFTYVYVFIDRQKFHVWLANDHLLKWSINSVSDTMSSEMHLFNIYQYFLLRLYLCLYFHIRLVNDQLTVVCFTSGRRTVSIEISVYIK